VALPSTGSISIRSARREDIDQVLALWEQARSAAASTPDTAETVTRLIEHTPDALLVAECDGELAGTLIAGWDGWRGNMYRLAVLPAYRRRGVARRLVEAGHERLRAKGARRVTALVDHAEEDATALWRATGYRLDEQISRFVRNL
jgi:ribosomal protein S18 acetylase RimI-like enzyme